MPGRGSSQHETYHTIDRTSPPTPIAIAPSIQSPPKNNGARAAEDIIKHAV